MNDYAEYERLFEGNVEDFVTVKLTLQEYKTNFNQIVNKIRADAIDEFLLAMKKEIHIEQYFMDINFKHTIEDIARQLKEHKNDI